MQVGGSREAAIRVDVEFVMQVTLSVNHKVR
jgi:hypothetical protein